MIADAQTKGWYLNRPALIERSSQDVSHFLSNVIRDRGLEANVKDQLGDTPSTIMNSNTTAQIGRNYHISFLKSDIKTEKRAYKHNLQKSIETPLGLSRALFFANAKQSPRESVRKSMRSGDLKATSEKAENKKN